jgi:hypothetical protein
MPDPGEIFAAFTTFHRTGAFKAALDAGWRCLHVPGARAHVPDTGFARSELRELPPSFQRAIISTKAP